MRKIFLAVFIFLSVPVWAQEWSNWGKKIVFSDSLKNARKITDIDQALQDPLKVYFLELAQPDAIRKFCGHLPAFKNLHKLVLLNRTTETIVLPEDLWALNKLEYLVLFNLQVISFNGLQDLGAIKYLSLDGAGVKEIPAEIFELKTLEVLDLSCNRLTVIPPEISKLVNLVEIELTNNCFTEIPPGLIYLPQLVYLTINNAEKGGSLAGGNVPCNNSITQFPVFLEKMKHLKKVSCFYLTGVEKEMRSKMRASFPWIKFD